MFRPQESKTTIPMLDVCVGGVFLPRGKAVPLIVQLESARELRRSGVFIERPEPQPAVVPKGIV